MNKLIVANKRLREAGKFIGIPLYLIFSKLGNVLPSLPRGSVWMISAASGIGKSKFARFLIRSIYSIYKDHINRGKNPGFKPYFLVFMTEESKDDFKIALMASLVKKKYNYTLDKLKILSMAKEPLTDQELKYLEGIEPELIELLSFMEINDSISNPYGIYKYCRRISQERGKHYYVKLKDGTGPIDHIAYEALSLKNREYYKYSHYVPDDPEEYMMVMVDNLNNLSPERSHNGDLRLAMVNWSRDYVVKQMVMHWKWTVVEVIQQAMDTEKKQFTSRGDSIMEKLKPSIAGLGDSKTVARDTHIFTGLFKPAKYGINKYEGYNTSKAGLGLNYISAIFEKNRIGSDTFEISLSFDGATEDFKQLGNPVAVNKIWEDARKRANK